MAGEFDLRIAAPARLAQTYIPDGGAATRPIVAAVGRFADVAAGIGAQERRDDEADAEAKHRAEMERLERERAATIADRAGGLAVLRAELAALADESRVSPEQAPGAVGHGDRYAAEAEKKIAAFRATLGSDPEVTQRFEPLLQGEQATSVGRERAWELGQRGRHQTDNWKKYRDSTAIRLQDAPTGEAMALAMAEGQLLLSGMSVTPDVRAALEADMGATYATTVLDAQLSGGPEGAAAVRKVLDEGLFDAFLTADQKEGYRKGADLVDQRAAAEAEAAAREAAAAAKEQVATIEALIAQGATPTDEQMKALEAAAALLPPSDQVDVAGLRIGVDVAKRTRGMSAASLMAYRDQLQAKADAGKASQWEEMALRHVVARYENEADKEADADKEAVATPQGRYGYVRQLSAAPDRAAAFVRAERASPGLGHVLLLPTRMAQETAIAGKEIRKAQPDLIDMDKARKAMRATLGRVSALLGDEFDDKLELAADIYAYHAARRGATKDKFDTGGFANSVQLAMGATWKDGVRYGGIGRVNGGAVLIPDRSTEASFTRSLARYDYPGAVDAQGRAVAKSWIVGQTVPVWQRDDPEGNPVYYLFDAAGHVVQHKDGGAYRLTIR